MNSFKSILKNELNDLLLVKRAKGLKYESEEKILLRIDNFLFINNCNTKELSKEL